MGKMATESFRSVCFFPTSIHKLETFLPQETQQGKPMKKRVIFTAVLSACVLAGCGSKQDVNEKNFGAAINQYLDKKGELCLGVDEWPVDVDAMDLTLQKSMPTGKGSQMDALAAVGLASGAETEIDAVNMFSGKPTGKKVKVKRYVLTDAGKKFYIEKEAKQIGLDGVKKIMKGDICYGKKSLDKVVKWEGPMKLGDYQEASVKYLYKIDGLADWTKKAEIQTAFPYIVRVIDGAGKEEQRHTVKLTSEGWEANGLDSSF